MSSSVSEATGAASSKPESPQKPADSADQRSTGLLGNQGPSLSYSQLLQEIEKGEVKDLVLSPARREVQARLRDGGSVAVIGSPPAKAR